MKEKWHQKQKQKEPMKKKRRRKEEGTKRKPEKKKKQQTENRRERRMMQKKKKQREWEQKWKKQRQTKNQAQPVRSLIRHRSQHLLPHQLLHRLWLCAFEFVHEGACAATSDEKAWDVALHSPEEKSAKRLGNLEQKENQEETQIGREKESKRTTTASKRRAMINSPGLQSFM